MLSLSTTLSFKFCATSLLLYSARLVRHAHFIVAWFSFALRSRDDNRAEWGSPILFRQLPWSESDVWIFDMAGDPWRQPGPHLYLVVLSRLAAPAGCVLDRLQYDQTISYGESSQKVVFHTIPFWSWNLIDNRVRKWVYLPSYLKACLDFLSGGEMGLKLTWILTLQMVVLEILGLLR